MVEERLTKTRNHKRAWMFCHVLDKFFEKRYHISMNFEAEFRKQFGDKYENLTLKNAVICGDVCTITFLYPSQSETLDASEKAEICDFFKEKLNLSLISLKVKFLKVYVEEKLIRKTLSNIISDKFKLLNSYITDSDIHVEITNIDCTVTFDVSPRLAQFFADNKASAYIARALKEEYLVNFNINLNLASDKVDEVDLDSVEVKVTARRAPRYDVLVVKDIIGTGILPKPEYISSITSPKSSVILAGYVSEFERKDFIIKKGARVGQQKAYFKFNLSDGKGKIECIYFSPNKNVAVMEAIEEHMFLLLHGDVRVGFNNKLTLYIDKIALASETEQKEEISAPREVKKVEIERLGALEQDSLFGDVERYNHKVMDRTIVVFDVETTGLNPEIDQIIELGAVKIERGNIIEKFSTFVRPTIEIPYEVTELTHITNDMVADAPDIEDVIKQFYDFSKDCVLCGHNIINFDIKFIRRFGDLQNLEFDNAIIDTLNEVRVSHLKISRFNLGTVTKALGIELKGAHRAWNDAFATAQVLLKLNEVGKKI